MTQVIGLIGRIASGKTVVADFLVKEKGAVYYRFSDVLKDVLVRLHMPNTRENLQNLGLALRGAFGDGVLAHALKEDLKRRDSKLIVVDGIRYQDEFDMVKALGGKIVYVTAPQKARYERAKRRATRGEAHLSFEEFVKSENKETERLIDVLGKEADVKIENTGTIDELKKQAERLILDSAEGP